VYYQPRFHDPREEIASLKTTLAQNLNVDDSPAVKILEDKILRLKEELRTSNLDCDKWKSVAGERQGQIKHLAKLLEDWEKYKKIIFGMYSDYSRWYHSL
jgi:hypothetical protein